MRNSWDNYYDRYSDWDEAHVFNVKVKLEYEGKLSELGYAIFERKDETSDFSLPPRSTDRFTRLRRVGYIKTEKYIQLSFRAPYDWSIDSDWEDKALELLRIKEEWVLDSMVEDE